MDLPIPNTTSPASSPDFPRVRLNDSDDYPTASAHDSKSAGGSVTANNADINVAHLGTHSNDTAFSKDSTHSSPAIISSISPSPPHISTKPSDNAHLDPETDQLAPEPKMVSHGRGLSTSKERQVLNSRKLNIPSTSKKSVLLRGKIKAKSQKPKSPSSAGRSYSGLPPRPGHIQIAAFNKKLEASKALAKKNASLCREKPEPQPLTRTDRYKAIDLMVSILMNYRKSPGLINDFFWEVFSRQSPLVLRTQFDEILEKEEFFVSNFSAADASRDQVKPLSCFSYDATLDAQHDQRIHRISKFSSDSDRKALPSIAEELAD